MAIQGERVREKAAENERYAMEQAQSKLGSSSSSIVVSNTAKRQKLSTSTNQISPIGSIGEGTSPTGIVPA